ncbi:hypothetical protein [Devosia chinhatensis]|uniref:hypothetical protein n=1 Tax=Devosia chinhatensis TaxID=429727 RepID=UPI000A760407|nr:hypothetical protein [Devosia chinhatensis]
MRVSGANGQSSYAVDIDRIERLYACPSPPILAVKDITIPAALPVAHRGGTPR